MNMTHIGRYTPAFRAGLSLAVLLGLAGCRQAAPAGKAAQAVRPDYDKTTGQLKRLDFDSDGNGRIDTWGYMDGARVVRVEIDENGDGTVDRWEYHAALPAGSSADPKLSIERIERATRLDGKISRWEYFTSGSLSRVEEDTDGDGKVDKWETYADGNLLMMALDTKKLGKADQRLLYRADGTLDRIETDPTGSGTFQTSPPARP